MDTPAESAMPMAWAEMAPSVTSSTCLFSTYTAGSARTIKYMEEFADLLWNSLNEENKVSLFVRYIDIETGNYETKIVNKNK